MEKNSSQPGSSPRAVTVFHTPGCGRCQAARQFFSERGVNVEMLDVANDFGALRRMARVSKGSRTVPVILCGDEVFVGFDPDYWRARLGEQA